VSDLIAAWFSKVFELFHNTNFLLREVQQELYTFIRQETNFLFQDLAKVSVQLTEDIKNKIDYSRTVLEAYLKTIKNQTVNITGSIQEINNYLKGQVTEKLNSIISDNSYIIERVNIIVDKIDDNIISTINDIKIEVLNQTTIIEDTLTIFSTNLTNIISNELNKLQENINLLHQFIKNIINDNRIVLEKRITEQGQQLTSVIRSTGQAIEKKINESISNIQKEIEAIMEGFEESTRMQIEANIMLFEDFKIWVADIMDFKSEDFTDVFTKLYEGQNTAQAAIMAGFQMPGGK